MLLRSFSARPLPKSGTAWVIQEFNEAVYVNIVTESDVNLSGILQSFHPAYF